MKMKIKLDEGAMITTAEEAEAKLKEGNNEV